MPYLIPLAAIIGGGVALLWGGNKIINQDDSTDEKVAKFLANIPSHIRQHIKEVTLKDNIISISLNNNTPDKAKAELESVVRRIQET